MALKDLKSMSIDEIKKEFSESGYPTYRAKQVYDWLYKGVESFDEMNNIPKQFRNILKTKYEIRSAVIEKRLVSSYDETKKYLLRLNDGEFIESVLMKYKYGYSVCVSTQVGCKMGCSFCATGKGGFLRNLYPSEILSQIQTIQKRENIRISHVVLMGMGEPLDNYDNVIKFLRLVSSDDGLNISARHISLSTCGVVDKIYKLADEKLQITLSISLHAPNDTIRSKTMPINRRWNINELLEACRYYIKMTNRRISFEYALISGVNDSDKCAYELSKKLKGLLCHVNLIPVNEVTETNYKKSNTARQENFKNILAKNGLNATIRRTLGKDINASCGQLRRNCKNEVEL